MSDPIYTYTMHGQQARVFPFAPNWASPVNEIYEWKTEVLRAYDGTEQRRQLRTDPRRSFEYSLMQSGDLAAMLENHLWSWHDEYYALPVWTDVGRLSANVNVTDRTINVITDTLDFHANEYAIIWHNPKLFEVIEIESVTSGSITVKSGLAKSWSQGSKIFPLVLAHLPASVPTQRLSSNVIVGTVTFNTTPDLAPTGLPSSTPAVVYDGYEVITSPPNWKNSIDNEFIRLFETADSGIGAVRYYPRESASRVVRPFAWSLFNRSAIMAFKAQMRRLAGQAKPCWIPSWVDDMVLATGSPPEASVLTIKGSSFDNTVNVDTSRDRVVIRTADGQTLYRRITNTSPNYLTDATQLQLDSVLGTTVSSYDNVRLLHRCRLATDKIVIPWLTDTVANPITNFTTIKL